MLQSMMALSARAYSTRFQRAVERHSVLQQDAVMSGACNCTLHRCLVDQKQQLQPSNVNMAQMYQGRHLALIDLQAITYSSHTRNENATHSRSPSGCFADMQMTSRCMLEAEQM